MSEYSRKHHNRSTDVRYDRYYDDPSYRETHDDYDHNYRVHPDAADRTHYYDDPETEEVWLKEKLSRITYNDHDLRDFDRIEHSTVTRTLASFAGVAVIAGLIGFLALSTEPDLSPEEIIAMDGYAGEQKTKALFNLASLRDCEAGAECSQTGKTVIDPTTSTSRGSETQSTSNQSSTTIDADIARTFAGTDTSSREDNDELQEIPAAKSPNTAVTDRSVSDNNNSSANDLIVLQQWSNVRGTPEINGRILTSLAVDRSRSHRTHASNRLHAPLYRRPAITTHRLTIRESFAA